MNITRVKQKICDFLDGSRLISERSLLFRTTSPGLEIGNSQQGLNMEVERAILSLRRVLSFSKLYWTDLIRGHKIHEWSLFLFDCNRYELYRMYPKNCFQDFVDEHKHLSLLQCRLGKMHCFECCLSQVHYDQSMFCLRITRSHYEWRAPNTPWSCHTIVSRRGTHLDVIVQNLNYETMWYTHSFQYLYTIL